MLKKSLVFAGFFCSVFACYLSQGAIANKTIPHAKTYYHNLVTSKSAHEISLNGTWQFKTDPNNEGEQQQWFDTKTNIKFTDEQKVPGNWNLKNEYANYTGKAWYKREVFIPANLKGKLLRLYFEGVYNDSKVWVNGKFVIENNLGYLEFEKDVSEVLNYGGMNTIAVCADNSFKVGALWNWGGIRLPVKLLINSPVYIVQNHITPNIDLEHHTADVSFDLAIFNKEKHAEPIKGNLEIYQQGTLVKTIPFDANIAAGRKQQTIVRTHLVANSVKLWSLDAPNLYTCKVIISKNGTTVDEHEDRFGLRKIELDNVKHQFKLNGEVIRPLGFNLVPDDRTNGNTLPLWRIKEDIDLMKSLGAGMARMSHVPYHKELLDYLDEKGLLIFEEIPVWGSDKNPLVKTDNPITSEWLRRMISNHYNHACVAGWSVGNEIGYNPDVMGYVENSIKLVKATDTSHMGVMISHSANREKDPLQFSDLGFINSYGSGVGSYANKVNRLHPTSTLFFSEFGYGQLSEELGADFKIKALMDSISQKPFLIGASLWTFNDYRSPYKDTKEYSQNRPWGLVDVFRQKKKAFYSYQKANMPFASIELKDVNLNADKAQFTASLSLTPHGIYDIPAYTLHNYRITWQLLNKHNTMRGGGSKLLNTIKPGDEAFDLPVNCSLKDKDVVMANISIVSPLNYTRFDTTVYFEKPSKINIISADVALDDQKGNPGDKCMARIIYQKNDLATSYKLKYEENGVAKETAPTINNYMVIHGLTKGELAKATLVSINNAGETATDINGLKIEPALLSPLIRYTEPADGGFFTSFETLKSDDEFMVQVTEKAGDYNHAKETTANVKGVMAINGLTNGKTYYYRIKRNKAGEKWSEEVAVIPDGGIKPAKPEIQGVILADNNEAVICFQSVKKAIGYQLQYKSDNEVNWHKETITASSINQHHFKIAADTRSISVKLAAVNQYGFSDYSTCNSAQ